MRTLLRYAPLGFGLGLALLSACSANDQGATDQLTTTPVSHITHTMPPGSTSTASIRTLSNATCQLRVVGQANAKALRVLSDDQGVARVQLDHLDPSVTSGQLTLDCADGSGASMSHTIDVVIDANATAKAPAKYDVSHLPTLPTLDTDPATLSDSEIFARHYPPRPDAASRPAEYAEWLALTKSAPAVFTPHLNVDPTRFNSTSSTSNNWSGYVIKSPSTAPTYAWIYGQWNVPQVYAESGFASFDDSSYWVGLDGWNGSGDVVQDGTSGLTVTGLWIQTSWYYAWVEWYPLSEETVSNFPVNPGDEIHAWTWMRDANGNWSNNPTVGWFYMWNKTEGYYVYTSIDIPAGTTFTGHEAEWIMERPSVVGVTDLANYSYTQLTDALAYDVNGAPHLYGGDSSNTSYKLTMEDYSNNNTVLSTVAPVNSNTMAFTFHNHD